MRPRHAVAALGIGLAAASLGGQARADDAPEAVLVRGDAAPAKRGVFELTLRRDLLDASPRQRASELLSAAPGFFVDHEDGEGLGNDVYLRGFDLEHGAGIEFHVGSVPINAPTHLLGQGYADVDFVIPEVVRSLRVREGVYDPRQGDAAIVGSVDFDLGVTERGVLLKSSYGSFRQARAVAVVAPEGEDEQSFVALALRRSDGFGEHRATRSASGMGSYALQLDEGTRLRAWVSGYEARADLAGVLRDDDLAAGRVGFYDRFPSPLADGQSTLSTRLVGALELDRPNRAGGHLGASLWAMRSTIRLRQNFTGNLESSNENPSVFGLGDLLETRNAEDALGASLRYRTEAFRPLPHVEVRIEPGISARGGATAQGRDLISPNDYSVWDRRIDADVRSLDVGPYLDVDARVFRRLRLSGGLRADALLYVADDHLAGAAAAAVNPTPGSVAGPHRKAFGVAASPRVTIAYDVLSWLTPSVSYGEGFRSLDARHLRDGESHPYSKVTSGEVGARARVLGDRFVTSLAFYETRVANELVFEAVTGGLETQGPSVRRGMIASLVTKPIPALLGSFAFSVNRAKYEAATADGSHFVPSIPAFLFRADTSVHGALFAVDGRDVAGRLGSGLTVIGPKHLTDRVETTPHVIWNASAAAKYRAVELGVDVYNLLGLKYPDDEAVFVSNWSTQPGQPPASFARHSTAAPPRTILGTLALTL